VKRLRAHPQLPAALMALSTAFVMACAAGSTPSSATATATPSPAATSGDRSTAVAASPSANATPVPQRFTADGLDFTYPAAWQARVVLPNPSGNWTMVFVGSQVLPSECTTSAGGVAACGSWPLVRLTADGTIVAWRFFGMPGEVPPTGGTPTLVGARQARSTQGPADDGCAALGGDESIGVVVAHPPRWHGWLEVDACLAGPDQGPGEAALGAMLASAAFP